MFRVDIEDLFNYDSETGVLTFKARGIEHFKNEKAMIAWNGKNAGNEAGHIHKCIKGHKYRILSAKGNPIKAHRAAWFLVYGEFQGQIDHENGDGTDNRISNLRLVTNQENQKNASLRKDNKTGVTGVRRMHGKFAAQIRVNQKDMHLGTFSHLFDAVCARKSAELKHGFHRFHGKIKEQKKLER